MAAHHASLDVQIADAKRVLAGLHDAKRRQARQRIDAIVAEHDAGRSNREIADARGLSICAVIAVLHRAGRTSGGRTAIKQAIREAVTQVAA